MLEVFSILFAVGFFGMITQRTTLGSVLSLQLMTTSIILALSVLAKTSAADDFVMSSALSGRAQDAGLVIMVVFQLQSIAILVYGTRLHYLRSQQRGQNSNGS